MSNAITVYIKFMDLQMEHRDHMKMLRPFEGETIFVSNRILRGLKEQYRKAYGNSHFNPKNVPKKWTVIAVELSTTNSDLVCGIKVFCRPKIS